jgi:hypothetical protein
VRQRLDAGDLGDNSQKGREVERVGLQICQREVAGRSRISHVPGVHDPVRIERQRRHVQRQRPEHHADGDGD